jgi:hypothetical protein
MCGWASDCSLGVAQTAAGNQSMLPSSRCKQHLKYVMESSIVPYRTAPRL